MPKAAKKTGAFVVIDKGLRILITPSDGWYAVQGLDIRGLNTQGRTIEEAIYMAHDAADALAGAREAMSRQTKREITMDKPPAAPPQRRLRRSRSVGAGRP